MNKLVFSLIITGTLILFAPQISLAQGEDLKSVSITPFLQELDVTKGDKIESSINVTNETDQQLTINISTRDFLPGNRGEPEFIPDNEFNEATFSLASWITIPVGSNVTLDPKETKEIKYVVSPPGNAEQGTHYGAVMFSYGSGEQLAGVGITQSVGAIILVSYGQARSQASTVFLSDKLIEWWNDSFVFTNVFSNTGNVHVKPKGEIYITNIFGTQVTSLPVNRDAANVLPQSDRTFISEWYPSRFAFGPYKAELKLTYGRERLEIADTVWVWVLPIYLLVLIGLLLSIVIWYLLHGRHWHRRRVIKKFESNTKL